jgi:beta-N-acetylhexosaminidase
VRTSREARRRRNALGVVAATALIGGAVVGASAGGDDEGTAAVPGYCDPTVTPSVDLVAGQTVMVRMEAQATDELLDQARRGEIGGIVLFPPSDIAGDRLADEIKRVQSAAADGGNPRLLVAIDQEGGIVERLPALPPQLSPFTIAENNDRQAARLEGEATGFQLRELGIDVDLAPVLDVPATPEQFMAPRAFGSDPRQVADLGLAFASGLRREAVAATAKHFPGLGRAVENTDFAPTEVTASRAELRSDLRPFEEAIQREIELIMLSSASYPPLRSPGPAVLSPTVATGLLRDRLGFRGVAISDDLLAPGISARFSPSQAAARASAAGVDVLLFAARDVTGIARRLTAGAQAGRLDEEALRASCNRVVALKDRLATGDPLE